MTAEMETRILETYNSANPDQIVRGATWYARYRISVDRSRGSHAIENACAVIGVSSINTNPAQGLNWARKFMNGETNRGHLDLVVSRAELILSTVNAQSSFDTLRDIAGPSTSPARKVRNFACNVYTAGETCTHIVPCVTIDRWANRIATGDAKSGVPSGKNYDAVADAYRNVAVQLDIPVAILQAITWVVVAEPNGPRN
jgi:hypothetical protein